MYLIYFSNTYHNFRLPELDSLLELFGYNAEEIYDKTLYTPESPFLVANFPDDDCVKKIASRAILIKSIYRLWCEGNTWEELFASIQSLPDSQTQPYYEASQSWKFDIVAFNRTLTPNEQEQFRLKFEPYMPFEGPVRMKKPDNAFACVMHYKKEFDIIHHLYLGILVADGQRQTNDRYDLKKRHYIGPTSTCAELSFLMSNQIQTLPGSLVWDCFVGTGSLLVAATAHGGICLGSDIDLRVLKGLKKGKQAGSIRQNFAQYGLSPPELVRMDLSALPIHMKPMFDGIICDPPYGIRAGARRTKTREDDLTAKNTHKANTEIYSPDDVIVDLLDLAARMLVVGGRISYLFPILGSHTDEEYPQHPCLQLVSNSEEKLTLLISRRLITMKKTCEYDPMKASEYKQFTRNSLLSQNLDYSDLMETTVESNRSEGKTRSQRRERQIQNAKKWKATAEERDN